MTKNFIKSIYSLMISQVIIKIFGVIYTLYLTNKKCFGDYGNAVYLSGYQIYALLLTISSIGVPTALSKIISEKNSFGDNFNINRILKISIILFGLIGIFGSFIIYFFSEYIASYLIEIPEANFSLKILSPAIFFVSIQSVLKGYFNGKDKIYITARMQFFEQILKTIFTILFIEILSGFTNNIELLAGSANFATTLSTLISLIVITNIYYKEENENVIRYQEERVTKIVNKILKITIPITISILLTSFGKTVDSITIVRMLKKVMSEKIAKEKYGIIISKIDTLIVLPLSFNSAISISVIPEISKYENKQNESARKIIKKAMLFSFLIAMSSFVGMFVFSKEIFTILYSNNIVGYELLKISSISIMFSVCNQINIAILQAIGKNIEPVYISFIGVMIKLLCNLFLINNTFLERGAIMGNVFSTFVMFLISFFILNKELKIIDIFVKNFESLLNKGFCNKNDKKYLNL